MLAIHAGLGFPEEIPSKLRFQQPTGRAQQTDISSNLLVLNPLP
jgi:hypothetical protein